MTVPLACTVRDCGLFLQQHGRSFTCARGHSFDIAKRGYVNLLQPNDRRSLAAGDSVEAVTARVRLLEQGVGRLLIDAVAARTSAIGRGGDVIIDLGAGAGDLLATLVRRVSGSLGVGLDLSTAAAEFAARRYPDISWVVANADRRLPFLDGCVDVALSVHGRRNPAECHRVLSRDGHLIVAVPAPDDLVELRERVLGRAVARQRGATLVEAHAPYFSLVDRYEVSEVHTLESNALRDLLRGTYRGARRSLAQRAVDLGRLTITLSSSVFVFRRRAR